MAKQPTPNAIAARLSVWERVLLFCVASDTDWQRAGVPSETVSTMVVKGLVMRDAVGQLVVTDRGRAVFQALISD